MTSPPDASRPGPLRRLVAFLIAGGVAAWWIVPSPLVELVIQKRDVLLGRYSEERLGALIVMTLPLLFVAGGLGLGKAAARAACWKGALSSSLLFVGLFGAALLMGPGAPTRYVEQEATDLAFWPRNHTRGKVRKRPPNLSYTIVLPDEPPTRRSYPGHPTGYRTLDITLNTDHRGFRNPLAPEDEPESYDVVVIGDSFAEGSHISDEQTWPRRLTEILGVTTYNMGMSGSGPPTYLNNLLAFVEELQPKTVVCLIYEGNDFKGGDIAKTRPEADVAKAGGGDAARDAHADEGEPEGLQERFKTSLLGRELRRALVNGFEAVAADDPLPDHPALDFMPVRIGAGDAEQLHTFKPKDLMRLNKSVERIVASDGWDEAVTAVRELKAFCDSRGTRLIVAYAPTVAHVVMPLIADELPAERLHAFVALREDDLPPPEEFKAQLYAQLDNYERTFAAFCAAEGIEFLSPTAALQEQTRAGRQLYFTYDEHWTPDGADVFAGLLADHLRGGDAGTH